MSLLSVAKWAGLSLARRGTVAMSSSANFKQTLLNVPSTEVMLRQLYLIFLTFIIAPVYFAHIRNSYQLGTSYVRHRKLILLTLVLSIISLTVEDIKSKHLCGAPFLLVKSLMCRWLCLRTAWGLPVRTVDPPLPPSDYGSTPDPGFFLS